MGINLDQFKGVRNYPGLEKESLLVKGQTEDYVPVFLKVNWFYSVFQNGRIDTEMLTNIEDAIRLGMCAFKATIYADETKIIATGHGTSPVQIGVYDSFIQVAEGHAISRALNHSGFNWHSGDFSKEELDNAKNPYLPYVNHSALIEINSITKVLYAEAMETILPEGYGTYTGKKLSEATFEWITTMAKNYGTLTTGDKLINDMVYFVYLYTIQLSDAQSQEGQAESNEGQIVEENIAIKVKDASSEQVGKKPVTQKDKGKQHEKTSPQEENTGDQSTPVVEDPVNNEEQTVYTGEQSAPLVDQSAPAVDRNKKQQSSTSTQQKPVENKNSNQQQVPMGQTNEDEIFFEKVNYTAYLDERKQQVNKLLQEGNDAELKALINETIAPLGYPDANPQKIKTTLKEIFKTKKDIVRQVYEQKARSTYSLLDYFVRSYPM